MSKIIYSHELSGLHKKEAFSDATCEELRVLLALIECRGEISDVAELAKIASVSKPRCTAALTLWEEEGVIRKITDSPSVTEEFEDIIREGGIDEEPSVEVAKSIRDESLAGMLDECASIMKKASLSTNEVKNLTALYTQYALSAEFIVTLAAYLAGRGKLTAVRLKNEAIRLSDKGLDTLEDLEKYIEAREDETDFDWEIRRVLGIYNRNLSKSEKEYFKRWSEEFGYSVNIVSEAYDIAVINTGKGSLPYMDKLLTLWHEAGCTTVSECRAKSESDKNARSTESAPKKEKRTKSEATRYGSFDINEAFQNALRRSYGDEEK